MLHKCHPAGAEDDTLTSHFIEDTIEISLTNILSYTQKRTYFLKLTAMVRLETAPTGLEENLDYWFKYLNFTKPHQR